MVENLPAVHDEPRLEGRCPFQPYKKDAKSHS